MAASEATQGGQALRRSYEAIIPVAAVAIVLVMLVPLPAMILDLLLALSITAGVLVLLSALYILRPVQFSVFPNLLLLLTLFRLALNLASSRRILLHGNEGPSAAGQVIEAFGQFVVGGNYVVGFVLFLALIAIQYLVVSHGAVRTAEVTARFTLDALPGKQMAIDADLNAGLIEEGQAKARRQLITREAEFYGAMDGAARFNQRDAVATILITMINIVAGLLIGVFQLEIPLAEALRTYTILTVGDGLATMIPSLLVSVAGGMVVTRATSDTNLSSDLARQLITARAPLWIASTTMLVLSLIPGLPKFPFWLMAGATALLAWRSTAEADEAGEPESPADPQPSAPEALDALLKLDELSLEVGYGLVPLVDQKQGGQLLQRIRALRKHLALQLGFVVPPIHITDNLQLKPREYVVSLRGAEVARWEMDSDSLLAISSGESTTAIAGKDTREPAFGAPAKWITPAQQEQALAAGYAVVDQTSAMATHMAEVVKQYAHELLTRQETKRLLDALAETHPKLVEELVPKVLSLGEVQKVLQQLLREQVSVRDLPTILETLIDTATINRNPVLLVEAARQALSRTLVSSLASEGGKIKLFTLGPGIEEEIQRAFAPQTDTNPPDPSKPSVLRGLMGSLQKVLGEHVTSASPVLLCPSPARFHLRRLLEPFLPRVVVLSPTEIPPIISIESQGVVG